MTIHRSFACALLGLGVASGPALAGETGPVDSEAAVTAPAAPAPEVPAAEPTPAPQPREPALPSRTTPMPAPAPEPLSRQLLAPQFVHGDESTRWGAWVDIDHLFLTRDDDKRITDRKGISGGGLSVSYDLVRLTRKAMLSVDLGWAKEKSSASWTNGAAADVESNQLRVGAAVRYGLLGWLHPYAHVAGGAGRSRMDVKTGSGDTLSDKERFYQCSVGGGVSLRSPTVALGKGTRRVGLAINVEGGYIVGSTTEFTLKGPGAVESEKDPIQVVGVSVGDVSRSRPYLRISLGLRF